MFIFSGLIRKSLAAAVIRHHTHIHFFMVIRHWHTKLCELLCQQAGRDQKRQQQQKSRYFSDRLICSMCRFHIVRIKILMDKHIKSKNITQQGMNSDRVMKFAASNRREKNFSKMCQILFRVVYIWRYANRASPERD